MNNLIQFVPDGPDGPPPLPVSARKAKRKSSNQYTWAASVARVIRLDESIRSAAVRSGEPAPYRTEAVVRSLARVAVERLEREGRSLRSIVEAEIRRAA